MDILKTFEVFLSEPLSLLKNSIVQIVSLTTGNGMKTEITADMMRNKTQITVMNNEKIYKLLQRANAKRNNKLTRSRVYIKISSLERKHALDYKALNLGRGVET